MSALQTFLLVVDHNKEEAKQIAEQVAGGEYPPPSPPGPGPWAPIEGVLHG